MSRMSKLDVIYESPQNVRKVMKPSVRRRILPAFASLLTSLVMVAMCYHAYDYHLDRQSLFDIRSMDIEGPIPAQYFGRKTIDKWGRLQRRSSTTQCGEKWSNYQICTNSAILHSNCIQVCDTPYNTCPGCDLLQTNHDYQLSVANSHCETKKNAQCVLAPGTNGTLDYAALSQCCLSAAGPIGADACFCSTQQLAAGACFGYGSCQPATCNINSQTCTETYILAPAQPPPCEDTGAVKCDGPGTNQATQCGFIDGQQSYLQVNSKTCALSCDDGGIAENPVTGLYDVCSLASFYLDNTYDSFIGCFQGPFDALQFALGSPANTQMTPADCFETCRAYDMSYCGITQGGACYGDSAIQGGNQVANFFCTEVCAKDSDHFCGGTTAMIVIYSDSIGSQRR